MSRKIPYFVGSLRAFDTPDGVMVEQVDPLATAFLFSATEARWLAMQLLEAAGPVERQRAYLELSAVCPPLWPK